MLSEYFCRLLGPGPGGEGETVGGALAPSRGLDGRHFMSRYQTVLPAPNLFLKSHEVSVDRGAYPQGLEVLFKRSDVFWKTFRFLGNRPYYGF